MTPMTPFKLERTSESYENKFDLPFINILFPEIFLERSTNFVL